MCCVSQHAAFQEILNNWDENSYFYHLVQIIYLSIYLYAALLIPQRMAWFGCFIYYYIHMFLIKCTFNHLAEVFH